MRLGKVTARGRKKTTSGAWRYFLLHVAGPLTMSCAGNTVTNNKADAKSQPPVILTFLYVTDSGD